MAIMLLILFLLFVALIFFLFHRHNSITTKNLPPGSFGWPFIGETLAYIRSRRDGDPERFTKERIKKYGSPLVFKTSMAGERMAVFCGPEGNKFLFGNENKLVASWWPNSVRTLLGKCLIIIRGDEAKWLRKMMFAYLGPDALSNRYTGTMDVVSILINPLHHTN